MHTNNFQNNEGVKIMINGFSDPKFNKLRDVYEKNFHEELDIGSSLGISLNGEIVVNLWGGCLLYTSPSPRDNR